MQYAVIFECVIEGFDAEAVSGKCSLSILGIHNDDLLWIYIATMLFNYLCKYCCYSYATEECGMIF